MKTRTITLFILGFIMLLQSCSIEDELAYQPQSEILSELAIDYTEYACGDPAIVELIAGQHIYSGNVIIANDEDSVYVIYSTINDWSINEIHVYAGEPLSVPMTGSGIPIPGQFTHVVEFEVPVYNYAVSFPISDFSSDCFAVFAHASVTDGSSSEGAWSNNVGTSFVEGDASTAWTNGTSFADLTGTRRWGGYTEYCLQECDGNPSGPDCYDEETAWSFGRSFEDLTGTNRWGWYSIHNLGEVETYTIFAGQHIEVGNITILDDGENLIVDVEMTNGAYFNYMHMYVGDEEGLENLCNNSGAPVIGHFPIHLDQPNTTNHQETIALSDITFENEIIVAVHFEAMVPCP